MSTKLAGVLLLLVPSAMAAQIQTPASSRDSQTTLAIVHATVIDGTGNGARADTTVVIRGDRIVAIGSAGATKLPPGARMVDARGKYLIPGLWDMHVHLSEVGPGVLPILVAAGVTDVRDMGGDLVELRLWRDEIAAGMRLGPRVLMAGPILDGHRGADFHVAVTDAAEARAAVRVLAGLGVDFIKVHVSLTRDAYFAIAEESRRSGLQFVGHIPGPISAAEASDAGQAMIEHTESLLAEAAPNPKNDTQLVEQAEAYPADRARSLFERFARNGTAFDPTLIEYWVWAYADDPAIRADRRRDIASQEIKATWVRMGGDDLGWKDTGGRKRIFAKLLELVKEMNDSGVELVAGTDLAGPDILPGFALHDELGLLVRAGLTPMQALQAATRNAARGAGRGKELGTIEVDKLADLVILSRDPLADIGNVASIEAVILRGRLVDAAERERLLECARRAAAAK